MGRRRDRSCDVTTAALTAWLERAGVRLVLQTGAPAWRGERLDVDWAVNVLWRPRPHAAPGGGATCLLRP